MRYRFVVYGLLGWAIEVFWTGIGSLLKGDFTLKGTSYLWMFPVYGLAVFLEPIHREIRHLPWYIRGTFWTVVIFCIELSAGLAIKLGIGLIPWNYTGSSPYSIGGLIRLDYAPVWFAAGLLFEKLHDFLHEKSLFK